MVAQACRPVESRKPVSKSDTAISLVVLRDGRVALKVTYALQRLYKIMYNMAYFLFQ